MLRNLGVKGAALTLCACLLATGKGAAEDGWLDEYREPAARIIGAALADRSAWDRLADLSDNIGNRLSGSEGLEKAIRWAIEQMNKDGLENVRAEKVMVPHWVRGKESAEITGPTRRPMAMLGLGGSVGTTAGGVEAEVLVVRSFADLEANAEKARGRIVVYNVPYTGYGPTVQYRSSGASRAARLGAVAVLVRSVGLPGLRTAHTGALNYAGDGPRIPAAAIALEDAETLQRMQDRGSRVTVRLQMEAQTLPDAESANVVAELRGREKPAEYVVMGGHLDSWDVGTGSSDDGAGCIATWNALRILKNLNLRPRRTIRLVLFTNEENGLRGGLAYRELHKNELSDHLLMLESDSGVFHPLGFGFSGSDSARRTIQEIATLLRGISVDRISGGGGGADIGPSVGWAQIPGMSLEVEAGEYFRIHHTAADTVDKINPTDLAAGVAAIAVMTYVVADMPERLSR